MSYGLLWIETLVVALLWVAGWLALAGRVRRGWCYRMLASVIVAAPLAVLGGVVALTALLKIGSHFRESRFGYATSLLVMFMGGMVVLLRMAGRRGESRGGAMWPAGRLLLALAAGAVVWTMTIWNMDLAVRSQLAALRAEAGAIMLSVSPPAVNDSINAAVVYEKAFRRLANDSSWKQDYDEKHPFNQEKPDMSSPAVAEFLARHAETVALIKQGAALPECHFEHSYGRPSISMLLPELSGLREAARLLRLHGRYELSQGRVDGAIDDVNGMLRLSQHAGRSPVLIAALVGMATQSLALETLQEVLPAVKTAEELKRISLGDSDWIGRVMRRAMCTEEAFGLATFCDMGMGNITPGMVGDAPELVVWNTVSAQFGVALYGVFLISEDVSAYREVMGLMQAYSLKPYYEVRERIAQTERQFTEERRGICTSLVVSPLARAFRSMAMAEGKAEAARIAVAAVGYRLDRGRVAEKLEDLLPGYLKEVPLDPFDGKRMRYKVDGKDLVIYSVGPDLKDDGGREYERQSLNGDITFRVVAGQ